MVIKLRCVELVKHQQHAPVHHSLYHIHIQLVQWSSTHRHRLKAHLVMLQRVELVIIQLDDLLQLNQRSIAHAVHLHSSSGTKFQDACMWLVQLSTQFERSAAGVQCGVKETGGPL